MGGSMAAPSAQTPFSMVPGPRKVSNTGVVPQNPKGSSCQPVPYDHSDKNVGQVQSSYGYRNEVARPMENLPYRRTPVLPFNRKSDTSAYDVGRTPFELFSAQGFDQDSYRPKREQGLFFTPQPENIYGQPAQAEVARDRYQPSNELKHQKPFEAEWSLRSGGFHPTKRILPTNVPVLRQQLPQNYVSGPSHATSHPSGLFGEARGELGLTQRKGSDLSYYYRVPFPTSAATKAATNRAKIVDRPTARQCLSRPYGGHADAAGTGGGATYVPGKFIMNDQRLPSQMHARMQHAGGVKLQGGGATQAHYADQARATRAEFTEHATAASVTQVRAPVSAGFAPPQDVARTTRAEFTENQVAPQLYNSGAPGAPTAHFMDQARPTVGEFTELKIRAPAVANGQHGQAPMTYLQDTARATVGEATENAYLVTAAQAPYSGPYTGMMDEARPTIKQFTSDHEYAGGLGQSELQAAMNTDAYLNVVLNDKLEETNTAHRAPNQAPIGMVGTNADRVGYGDACTVRVRNDNAVNNYDAPPDMRGQGMDRWIPATTVNDNLAREERWVNDRNSPYVLGQLQNNPYAIPSYAQTGNMNLPLEVSAANPGNCNIVL